MTPPSVQERVNEMFTPGGIEKASPNRRRLFLTEWRKHALSYHEGRRVSMDTLEQMQVKAWLNQARPETEVRQLTNSVERLRGYQAKAAAMGRDASGDGVERYAALVAGSSPNSKPAPPKSAPSLVKSRMRRNAAFWNVGILTA